MAEAEQNKPRPIIIKKVKKGRHEHHGGSWKVAFADFATAMMAFFLLMWLMGNTSEEQKQAISGYFIDPQGTAATPGANSVPIGDGGVNDSIVALPTPTPPAATIDDLDDQSLEQLAEEKEREKLELLKDQLESLVETSADFSAFKDQILIDITPSGLRIQIVDKDQRPMFDSGSKELKSYSRPILTGLAQVLAKVPNKLSITGHTDSTPFDLGNYGNWELSADRANSARRALKRGGITDQQIARVEGFADSVLFDNDNPVNPINRRIAIIVLKQNVAEKITEEATGQSFEIN
ncbi:MAG: flagellar motor protein MotB [Kangiellaceae bacterium]|jgi:chemotaxis protein MotB|nr:flagellar motor protein MotB [Kangiellaceae bacterium]